MKKNKPPVKEKKKVQLKNQGRNLEAVFVRALKDGSLEKWASAGATDQQIARECLGMSIPTYYKYLHKYSRPPEDGQDPYEVETFNASTRMEQARRPIVIEAFEGMNRLSRGFHEFTTTTKTTKMYHADGTVSTKEETITEDNYYPPQYQASARVITNYLHHNNKGGKGVPDEYVSEASMLASKQGRLSEMDEALKALFFGQTEGGEDATPDD